jgi:hypothetical protein
MSVVQAATSSPFKGEGDSPQASGVRARGLSPQTTQLWLAATRARQRADQLAKQSTQ